MAILGKIRQRSLVLILVIAMALFSFVLADLFKGDTGFSKSENVVATINGIDIDRVEFTRQVENAQRRFGGQMSSTQAMNAVWDQEVRRAVMNGQYEDLGITVERDQMRALIKQNASAYEEFKNELGEFDENKLNEFIANLKEVSPNPLILGGQEITFDTWTTFEGNIADGGLYQNYFNLVKAGISSTLSDAEFEHKLENEKVDIRYVQVPYSSIPDSTISISQAEITAYVNEHKSQYEVEDTRDIRYVEFKEEPTEQDDADTKEDLLKLFNDPAFSETNDVSEFVNAYSDIKFQDVYLFKDPMPLTIADSVFARGLGESYGPYKQDNVYIISKIVAEKQLPDSVKVRHILVPFRGAIATDPSVVATEEQAKAKADSILGVLKNNRSKFKDLLALSTDSASDEKEGVIEFSYQQGFSRGIEFRDFSFENNERDMEVVRTNFGYHVVEILEQKNKQRTVKLANLALEIEPSEETMDAVFNTMSNFEEAVDKIGFDEAAKESNYIVKPVSSMKALDENIPGIGVQRSIVRWAFEDGVEVGDFKQFTIPSGGSVVVMLSGINKKGLMANDKASITAIPEIRKEKKAKLIMDRISGTTLEDVASSESQTVKTAAGLSMKTPSISGAGREPKIIGAAFGLKEGQTSKLLIGDSGVYMVEVTKVTPAPELPSYQSGAERLKTAKMNLAETALFNALKEASDIEDNRSRFY